MPSIPPWDPAPPSYRALLQTSKEIPPMPCVDSARMYTYHNLMTNIGLTSFRATTPQTPNASRFTFSKPLERCGAAVSCPSERGQAPRGAARSCSG